MDEVHLKNQSEFDSYNWCSASGKNVTLSQIIQTCKKFIPKGSKIFIGSDSFATNTKINFATVICVYGRGISSKYFFARQFVDKNAYRNLASRITEEVRRSVELAELLRSDHMIDSRNIELHLDVSSHQTKNGTSRYSEMLKGYVAGAGFTCKIKPNAWASQTIADKHSK